MAVHIRSGSIWNLLVHMGYESSRLYTPKVELVIRGIKLVKVSTEATAQLRLPITPSISLEFKQVWSHSPVSVDNRMLWATICTV